MLQERHFFTGRDWSHYPCIISETANNTIGDALCDVIYEDKEQYWTKYCSLGHTTDDESGKTQVSLNYNFLGSTTEEGANPPDDLWVNSISGHLFDKEAVIYLIKGFGIIQVYAVSVVTIQIVLQDVIKMVK